MLWWHAGGSCSRRWWPNATGVKLPIPPCTSGSTQIGIGYAAAILFERWAQSAARPTPARAEDDFDTNARIAFLLRRLLVWVVGSVILVAVGFVVLEVMDNGVAIARRTALIPLVCVGAARALLSVFRTLFTPALPQ